MGRFDACRSLAELNQARTAAMTEINKEYAEAKKRIQEQPTFKRIPLQFLTTGATKELYTSYKVVKGSVEPHQLRVSLKDGQFYV